MTTTIATRDEGDVLVCSVTGRLDSTTSEAANVELLGLIGERRRVLLNLRGVDYVSSDGLRVLVQAAKHVRAQGGAFKLCHASNGIRISGLERMLDLHAEEASALAAF